MNFSNIDLNQLFLPDFPFQSIETVYDATLGLFVCKIRYNTSLNSYDNLQIIFRLPGDLNFTSTLNYKIMLNRQTDNNLALKVYSS